MKPVDKERLDSWLARLSYPGFKNFEDRDQAIEELQAAGAAALFPHLIPMLKADAESRAVACEVVLLVDPAQGVGLVLPLLHDSDVEVRWWACECLGEFGDERVVPALAAVLQSDSDPQVRGTAARGVGRLGGPAVIPPLLAALASDHETDMHGHSPSSCAATALDDILGTEETRLKFGNVCRMPDKPPDLDRLRRLAEERYREWGGGEYLPRTTLVKDQDSS